MYTNINRKKAAIFLAPVVLLLVISLGALGVQDNECSVQEEECCLYQEKPECPARYSSFNPSKNEYSPGEIVELTLSGLTDKYLIEEIKIEKLIGRDEGVVYTEVINQSVPVDTTEWTWRWNQVGSDGDQVANGRYYALVETDCCGIFRTNFKVQPKVRRPVCSCNCCGGWSTNLNTDHKHYETGEEVGVDFSNCRDCDIVFEKLYVKRADRCCGKGEIVYSQEFEMGYQPGKSWSWIWDQRNMSGNFVEPGRYAVMIETECCGKLSANFTVYEKRDRCKTSCCSSSFNDCGRRDRCSSSCCSSGFLFFGFCGSNRCGCRSSRTCNTCS